MNLVIIIIFHSDYDYCFTVLKVFIFQKELNYYFLLFNHTPIFNLAVSFRKQMSKMNLVADVFLSTESMEILKNKYVLFIGDSGNEIYDW